MDETEEPEQVDYIRPARIYNTNIIIYRVVVVVA